MQGAVRVFFRAVVVVGLLSVAAAGQSASAPTAGDAAQDRTSLYRQLNAQAEYFERQASVIKLVAKLVGPTVVFVEADNPARHSRGRIVEEAGSGVIALLGGKYYVLTSRHIIAGATTGTIQVTLADGRKIKPDRAWDDPETDVAVLAIAASGLTASPIGNSDRVEIGDFVLAVGSPFGLSNSVTLGIISAKGRRDLDLGDSGVKLQDFLQTDAAINPGNSGGPLVNLRGEVIGINTAIASRSGANEGIGFATPINMYMVVARQLIERGKVTRAYLGVTLDASYGPNVASELGVPRLAGARVAKVLESSPAAEARLQEGDIILEVDGVQVENDAHLVNLVNLTPIGKPVSLMIFRGGRTFSVRVPVADRAKF